MLNTKQMTNLGIWRPIEDGILYDWSASGFQFQANAPVTLTFRGEGQPELAARIGVLLNGKMQAQYALSPGKTVITLPIAAPCTVKVIKLTERQYGPCVLQDIRGAVTPAPVKEKHKILYVGDSLSAGYGAQGDPASAEFDTTLENVCCAYTYLSAQALHALPLIVAYSGNGILSRWIPPQENEPNRDDILPDIYPYDFPLEPDYVLINLGTNDASYVRQQPARTEQFIRAYTTFLEKLQRIYPGVPFALCYGFIETTLLSAVQKIAKAHDLPFIDLSPATKDQALGFQGHPLPTQHEAAAKIVTAALADKVR